MALILAQFVFDSHMSSSTDLGYNVFYVFSIIQGRCFLINMEMLFSDVSLWNFNLVISNSLDPLETSIF